MKYNYINIIRELTCVLPRQDILTLKRSYNAPKGRKLISVTLERFQQLTSKAIRTFSFDLLKT